MIYKLTKRVFISILLKLPNPNKHVIKAYKSSIFVNSKQQCPHNLQIYQEILKIMKVSVLSIIVILYLTIIASVESQNSDCTKKECPNHTSCHEGTCHPNCSIISCMQSGCICIDRKNEISRCIRTYGIVS